MQGEAHSLPSVALGLRDARRRSTSHPEILCNGARVARAGPEGAARDCAAY